MDKYNLGKIGTSKTELLTSEITTNGTYNLNDSVKNYKLILVKVRTYTTANNNNVTMLIDTDDITTTDGENCWIIYVESSRYVGFNFTNGYEKITVYNVVGTGGTSVAITNIIGIN